MTHWLISCWVTNVRKNSANRNMYGALPPPDEYGWKKDTCTTVHYKFDWDSSKIQTTVQETINFLIKGCSCKKDCKINSAAAERTGANVALRANVKDSLNLPTVNSNSYAPSIQLPIHQQEQSSEDKTESNSSEDSDTCSTNSERYDTEITTDNDYLLHKDSNIG